MQGMQDFNTQALTARLMRLVRLDTTVFDEVRLDASATVPSVVVAVASTFLAGIGGLLWWMVAGFEETGDVLIKSVILGSIFAVALWIAWVAIVYAILTQLFRAQADIQQLVRVMGMAAIPLALMLLMFIPQLDFGIGLASLALFFGLTNIAIQSATDASPGKVLVANFAGFAVWAIVLGFLVGSEDAYAPGFFLIDQAKEIFIDLADFANLDFSDIEF